LEQNAIKRSNDNVWRVHRQINVSFNLINAESEQIPFWEIRIPFNALRRKESCDPNSSSAPSEILLGFLSKSQRGQNASSTATGQPDAITFV